MAWSLVVGAGLPTLFMYCSTSQASNSLFSKQLWIVVRLVHPIISSLVFKLLRKPTATAGVSVSSAEAAKSERKLRQLNNVAFWMSAVAHILSICTAAIIDIQRRSPPANTQRLSLWPTLVSPWRDWPVKVKSLQEGIGIFLFWDEVVTSAAILLWALAINGFDEKSRTLYAVGKALVLFIAVGPAAAATTLARK